MAEVTIEQHETYNRIAISGRLDAAGVDTVSLKFNAGTCAARKDAIIDFSDVTFLASLGIRMLVSAARTMTGAATTMVLFAPQELVAESIDAACLDELIRVVDDEQTALSLLDS